jgi:hypothetical protein
MVSNPQGVAFEIHVVGEETGQTFTGKFFAKEQLSWRDRIGADRYRRDLLGVNAAEASIDAFKRASIIADLSVQLTDAPQWWKDAQGGLELIDDNVIIEVSDQAQKIRADWLEAQKKKGEEAKKALSSEKKV